MKTSLKSDIDSPLGSKSPSLGSRSPSSASPNPASMSKFKRKATTLISDAENLFKRKSIQERNYDDEK